MYVFIKSSSSQCRLLASFLEDVLVSSSLFRCSPYWICASCRVLKGSHRPHLDPSSWVIVHSLGHPPRLHPVNPLLSFVRWWLEATPPPHQTTPRRGSLRQHIYKIWLLDTACFLHWSIATRPSYASYCLMVSTKILARLHHAGPTTVVMAIHAWTHKLSLWPSHFTTFHVFGRYSKSMFQ